MGKKKSSEKHSRRKIIRWLSFAFISFLLFLFPSQNVYFQSVSFDQPLMLPAKFDLPPPPSYPVKNNKELPSQISAGAIFVKDILSGVVLYEVNANTSFSPASTTKMMTSLVALDHFQLDDVLTVPPLKENGRSMGLVSGEKLTFESLLYGTLVHSANDAAATIAENYPGGIKKFVEKMNEKAKELFLENTHFTNPVGYDDDKQYTTAKDLAKIAIVGLSNKTFSKIVSTRSISVSDITYTHFYPLVNVNELLGKVPGMSGVKTGFTENAGEILVSEVQKNGHSVLFVVLKSKDRFGETVKLIDWVFANFTWVALDEIIPAIPH